MTDSRGPDPQEDQTPFRYADGSPMRPDEAPTWPPLHVQRQSVTAPLPQVEQTRPSPVDPGDEAPDDPTVPQPVPRKGRRVVRATKAAPSRLLHATRRATEAQGAGESGLSRLIEVHALSSAGDAALAVGLAGTVFFAVPNGQARSQVLLFLLLTMLPFAIIAPLVGPLLDRFRHGRRWAIGATLAGRAFLCWVTAQTIEDHSNWLFPCALGVLVLSKAYLVTRSAAAPRLLPSQLTLVKANGRLSLAGVIGAGVGGVLAGVAAKVGPAWSLRVAFVLFVIGTVLAIMLPARVDSSEGEEPTDLVDLARGHGMSALGIGPDVVTALRANAGLRWLSGFLTIFLAFLVRAHPFPGWEDRQTLLFALVLGAAGVGNALGTVMGALLKIASPRMIVLGTLLADAVVILVAAVRFSLVTAVLVGLVAGIGQQLGKLALDSLIQDTVPERRRTSVFGRSEALLQLSWVFGGLVAVIVPLNATVGTVVAAVLVVGWTIVVITWHTGHRLPVPRRTRPADAGAVDPLSPGRDDRT